MTDSTSSTGSTDPGAAGTDPLHEDLPDTAPVEPDAGPSGGPDGSERIGDQLGAADAFGAGALEAGRAQPGGDPAETHLQDDEGAL